MPEQKPPEGGPCPPLPENETNDDAAGNPLSLKETDADYEAEETNAKEVKPE